MPAKPLKLIFAGTPEFAAIHLKALIESKHQLIGVYTQPDRPAGRGKKLHASPVKRLAQEAGVSVFQPRSLKDEQAQQQLAGLGADAMVVVAYGLIVPRPILGIPRLGCINIHASLLPRWRGAAPIQRAILAGDRETGVCIMQMDAGLDTGPVWSAESLAIEDDDTGGSLHDKLTVLGGQALMHALPAIMAAKSGPAPQPGEGACYASKLDKSEAMIDWNDSAEAIARRVRAFNPWPVAETLYKDKRLRIWMARPEPGVSKAPPGSVVCGDKHGVVVATGDGLLRLLQVQMPGKRNVTAGEFANAYPLADVCLGS